MKKTIILFCLVIFCLVSFGQVYQEMPQYGYRANRMVFDSTLSIPSVCGVPTLKSNLIKKAAIAFDSCNNRFYYYNPKTKVWSQVSGGSSFDSTSLSNRIDLKIDSLKRFSDSVYAYHNGVQVFQYRDSTFDSTSLSNRINLKVNISDTASMLSNYLHSVDTNSLSNRINLKVNIADTSVMLNKYLRIVDTANRWIQSITRTAGKDSIIFYKGGVRFSIKDSVGGGSSQNGRFGNDTATVVMVKVHNDAGVTLTNGKVVALTTSGNNNEAPAVRLANSKGDSTSANTLGFVTGSIANQDTGWVILSGKIEKLNTAAFSNGDIIYLDTISGSYTKVKPQAPTHLVYLGVVVKSNAGNGAIFVKCQNGYELDEIHDFKINGKVNNQVLAYSDTLSVWKNRNIYTIVDTSTTIATKTNLALKVNGTGTTGSISKFSGTNTITNATADVDYLQQDLTSIALQSLGSTIKCFNIGYPNPNAFITTQSLPTQQVKFIAIYIPKAVTLTGIRWLQTINGSYTASNYNGVGLYTYSGGTLTLVASSTNDGTVWSSGASTRNKDFSATYSASVGIHFIGFVYSSSAQTTAPSLATAGSSVYSGLGNFDFTNSAKMSSTLNTQTSLPSTQAMSGTTTSGLSFAVWVY